jgi:peptidoglycan/LPS O-acetylase OafA/YrhL
MEREQYALFLWPSLKHYWSFWKMSALAYDLFREKKVFGGLDGLRFISISAVVWHHSVGNYFTNIRAAGYGFLGVDLFFVISGFLIVTLLLRERELKGAISLRNFYVRRTLRIFPLYYFAIISLALFYLLIKKGSPRGEEFINDLPIYLLYLGNIFSVQLGIVWSLASEEQFYLVWPFLEKYFQKSIFIILAVALAINQFINFQRNNIADWTGITQLQTLSIMQATFTPILLGVLLAHLFHHGETFNRVEKMFAHKYAAVAWLLILVGTVYLLPTDVSGFPRLVVQLIMMLLVGSVVVNEENHLMPYLKFPVFARIGAISYGIYLFHIHAISAAEKLLKVFLVEQRLVVFVFAFVISIGMAEFSFRFLEAPFLRLKGRFSIVHQGHI